VRGRDSRTVDAPIEGDPMSLTIRKLRLQKGWTQDQLAEFAGLSVRSVQRIERGARPSLESLKSLAAVFEVDIATLTSGDKPMIPDTLATEDELEAIEYVKGIREFYMHAWLFAVFALVFSLAFGLRFGFDDQRVRFLLLAIGGWGIGVIIHGLVAYEVIRFLGPKWERALIERRLGRKL
jgi:XRE family transcriptional regulator, regulator of sulfur utilization